MKQGLRAALIDMDGVLYDSMPGHARAWHRMMNENGIATDPDEFFLYEGMTGGATIDLIIRREWGRPATDEEKTGWYARKAELFLEEGEKPLIKGSPEMVEKLKEKGLLTVLVTGSAQSSLLDRLNTDYPDTFPVERRVTAHDVANGKPHPEPYLKGAQKAGFAPEECLVVENAPLGVRAAKAAGCFTVAVMTGPVPRETFENEGADLVFPSMKEFGAWIDKNL